MVQQNRFVKWNAHQNWSKFFVTKIWTYQVIIPWNNIQTCINKFRFSRFFSKNVIFFPFFQKFSFPVFSRFFFTDFTFFTKYAMGGLLINHATFRKINDFAFFYLFYSWCKNCMQKKYSVKTLFLNILTKILGNIKITYLK